MTVLPADLIKSILARRQKMADQLPKELELRKDENDRAYKLAKASGEEFQAIQNTDETAANHEERHLLAQQTYDEHEQFRRRTSSRLQTIKNNIQDCLEAIDFWEKLADGGWGHLLEDAERGRSGGASSYAEAKRHTTNKEGES